MIAASVNGPALLGMLLLPAFFLWLGCGRSRVFHDDEDES